MKIINLNIASPGRLRGVLAALILSLSLNAQPYKTNYTHDYSQTLVMKVGISVPDQKGGTKIINTFEQALEIIKQADALSLSVPKIIYLVGWQYNGHDDKYPSMFEVNKALKRRGDKDARESLLWLMKEAKKYHTIVSLHINMTDAYENSPLWDEYVENDLLGKSFSGKLNILGNYNGRKAYQIVYKKEWEAGYTKMRIDSLLKLLPPLKEAGTIHVDAWIARPSRGHDISLEEEQEYQKKAFAYWREQGIDVTSEWVMDYMVGIVPFAWHFNKMEQEDYMKIPANVYTGSGLNPDVPKTDFALGFLFGKSMYGETVFPSLYQGHRVEEWRELFAKDFYLNCLQYFYLNKLKRVKVEGKGNKRVVFFSDDVVVSLADSTVKKGDILMREKNFVFFPVVWKDEPQIATYSIKDEDRVVRLPDSWSDVKKISIYRISEDRDQFVKVIRVRKGEVKLELKNRIPYILKPVKTRLNRKVDYMIKDGKIIFYGEGWRMNSYHAILCSPEEKLMKYSSWKPFLRSRAEESAPREITFHGNFERMKIRPGDVMTIRDPYRDNCGAFINLSKDILFEDVTIRGNRFIQCGFNQGKGGYVISIKPEIPHLEKNRYVHSSIQITDNEFQCFSPAVLYARSVDGLLLKNNIITFVPFGEAGSKPAPVLKIEHSTAVDTTGNKFTGFAE